MNNFGLRFHSSSLTDGASSIDKAFIMQKGKRREKGKARGKLDMLETSFACSLFVVSITNIMHV